MIKKLLFVLLAVVFCLSAAAQNIHRNSGVLNVFSEKEPFYLYVNGVQYNEKPSNRIRVESIPQKPFKIQVEFSRPYSSSTSLSPVHLYNELGEALEVTLLASHNRSSTKDLIVYAYHPVRLSLPDLNSFIVFDYDNPKSRLYEEQGANHFLHDKRLNSKEFSTFLSKLKDQSFDDDKMRIVPPATSGYMFTVDEIGQAMQIFDWDDAKLKFAEFMYPKCLDRENYLRLLSNLTFISSEDKLKNFIKEKSNASYAINRMTSSAFDDFMKGLSKQSFDQNKLDYIAAISSSTSFNVAQIKAILKTFSLDERKLDAAKVLMQNCSDKQLYYTLDDVFTFYSSKEAFLSFIKR